jgi:LacI family transcriptional regulator
MATIKDVAERAGVSVTTVSHVLNETRHVSPKLVARVRDAVESLRYQPNSVARSLRSKETRILGFIVPDNSNPYFAEVARSIEDASFDRGYNLILCNSDEDPEKERAYIDVLLERQVDGIVFVASGGQPGHLQAILERNIPLVVMDREFENGPWDSIAVDNRDGGYQATSHLLKLGHRRIGCISGPPKLMPSKERIEGYYDALRDARIRVNTDLMCAGNFHADGGYAAMGALLDRADPPTAVFVCNDVMAVGALRAIAERQLYAPSDISVVGFDNIGLANYVQPSLTTIAQPYEEIAQLATDVLIRRMKGDTSEPKKYRLKTTLIVRKSSGMRTKARTQTRTRPDSLRK